jgi:GDP-D-mannose dehydratase
MSTVRFERKGDMLNYVYLAPNSGTASTAIGDWTDVISKVELLIGDYSKAMTKLNWTPKTDLDELISIMINHCKKNK